MQTYRLGVNIDHVATIRNARGGIHPNPLRAAKLAIHAGADGITAHLREDRRHIRDQDMFDLQSLCLKMNKPLNMEMAVTQEMLEIAKKIRPHAVCLVPEKREEQTTEGGLDAYHMQEKLSPFIQELKQAGSRVSLFIEPEIRQLETAININAPVIELHTGGYCEAVLEKNSEQVSTLLNNLIHCTNMANEMGLEVHAGHGLDYETVIPLAKQKHIIEFNIGHFLIGEAILTGLKPAIEKMRMIIATERNS